MVTTQYNLSVRKKVAKEEGVIGKSSCFSAFWVLSPGRRPLSGRSLGRAGKRDSAVLWEIRYIGRQWLLAFRALSSFTRFTASKSLRSSSRRSGTRSNRQASRQASRSSSKQSSQEAAENTAEISCLQLVNIGSWSLVGDIRNEWMWMWRWRWRGRFR